MSVRPVYSVWCDVCENWIAAENSPNEARKVAAKQGWAFKRVMLVRTTEHASSNDHMLKMDLCQRHADRSQVTYREYGIEGDLNEH